MYKALESFTTKTYDIRRGEVLENDFTTQDEINEFLNIGYIEEYDGSIEIVENGTYDVEDYDTADVNVSGGSVNLQTKSVTITENTTTNITADSGYDGLDSVSVTTNVPSGGDLPDYYVNYTKWNSNGYPAEVEVKAAGIALPDAFFANYSSGANNINGFLIKVILSETMTIISKNCFWQDRLLETINLENIQKIRDSAFYGCQKLNNVNFNNVNEISSNAFTYCGSLVLNTLPDTLTILETSVFLGCTSIKKISMNNVTTIKGTNTSNGSFNGCTSLKKVWIGSAITSSEFSRYAFNNCSNLETMYINLPRATVEAFTNYQYAFMNDASKTGIIICNDDNDFIDKATFDALVIE